MAQSPLDNASGDHDSYLQNWNALSSMIVRGRSFSGFERHCAFLNVGSNPDGKLAPFANVSAATGFDLIDDGRALAGPARALPCAFAPHACASNQSAATPAT